MTNMPILAKGKTFYDPPPTPPPITKKQLLEIYLAYSAFLNGLKSYIQLNEQEGIDAILQKYYERLGKVWEEEKEKIKEIMKRRKTKEAIGFVAGKLGIKKEDAIKMTKSQLKDVMAGIGDLVKEAREEAFHKATTLQFTAEALKDLATNIDWQEKVIDDFRKTALERINYILDMKYGTVREYEDVLKSLFGEIKRKEIAEFNRVVGGYAKDLLDDKIKLDRFHSLMQGAIEEYYPKAYMAGRTEFGGKGLEKTHLGKIGKEIEEEKRYLKGFVSDISRGKVAGGSIEVRAGMYGDAIGGLYEQGKMSNFEDDPQVAIWWRLGIAEHCFLKGTKVATLDGEKNIEDIFPGDEVTVFGGTKKVLKKYQREYEGNLVNIEAKGLKVKCTPNHPFLVMKKRIRNEEDNIDRTMWIKAGELNSRDKIMVFQNRRFKYEQFLIYQEKLTKPEIVYNLEVEDVHHYIANGFIVHNCDDCIELAAGSPYGVDNPLPTYPGAGDTQCLSNCKCYLEIEKDGRWNGEIG